MKALFFVAALVLSGCAIDKEWMRTGVRSEECAEIKLAMRSITKSPVRECHRSDTGPRWKCLVYTEDLKAYEGTKIKGKWYFTEVVILSDDNADDLTIRWS